MGILAKGRKIFKNDGVFQLREERGTYIVNSDNKKDDIGGQNSYYWDTNFKFSISWRGPTPTLDKILLKVYVDKSRNRNDTFSYIKKSLINLICKIWRDAIWKEK